MCGCILSGCMVRSVDFTSDSSVQEHKNSNTGCGPSSFSSGNIRCKILFKKDYNNLTDGLCRII